MQLETLMKNVVGQPGRPFLAPPSIQGISLRPGHHFHNAWEFFSPLGVPLKFEVAGRELLTIPVGGLLLVPPGCVHMSVDRMKQGHKLMLVVMNLPGDELPDGGVSCGTVTGAQERINLSPEARASWNNLLGEDPGSMMGRAATALEGDGWAVVRGAALVRLIISAFGEAAAGMKEEAPIRQSEHRIRRVDGILRERFYDPALSLGGVATEMGLSPTHLAARFKALTGRTFWKTLVEIRLRRARSLLENGRHSVKEVAALTGWSSQLYFSAAFRRRFGVPPSATRAISRKHSDPS